MHCGGIKKIGSKAAQCPQWHFEAREIDTPLVCFGCSKTAVNPKFLGTTIADCASLARCAHITWQKRAALSVVRGGAELVMWLCCKCLHCTASLSPQAAARNKCKKKKGRPIGGLFGWSVIGGCKRKRSCDQEFGAGQCPYVFVHSFGCCAVRGMGGSAKQLSLVPLTSNMC